MEPAAYKKSLEDYIALIEKIRRLSAVRMDERMGADDYSARLKKDYEEIALLGAQCRRILAEALDPVLQSDETPPREILELLQEFCGQLLDPPSGQELDIVLLYEISDRLVREFRRTGDDDRLVQQLNMHLSVCYANVIRTARLTVDRKLSSRYRDAGLAAADELMGYVNDKDRFLLLDEEARKYAMNGARFYSALWDTWFAAPDTNERRFRALKDALALMDDPFYRDRVKGYNWNRYRIRCLEHMGQLTERGNRWGFTKEQCEEICGYVEQLWEMWQQDPQTVEKHMSIGHLFLLRDRNAYFAGHITKKTYADRLFALYDNHANDAYDMYAVQMNLLIPAELFSALRGERLTAKTEADIRGICDSVTDYMLRSVNTDAFNYLQEYLVGFLEEFPEIPGLTDYRESCLQILSALHPPTMIHLVQTARIARCLCGHLIQISPERFIGVNGCKDAEEVRAQAGRILTDIYYGGLLHDAGKLCMIDTIFVYGRALFDSEREIIRMHPLMGAEMLGAHHSTRRYADMALRHQIWHDRSAGYPVDRELPESPDRPLIDILAVADALDAGTDPVGRSYRDPEEMTLEQLIPELTAGAGTRYAPDVVALLSRSEVLEDLGWLVGEGRESNYRHEWLQLKEMQEKGRNREDGSGSV